MKRWLKSKTFYGVVLGCISWVLKQKGIPVPAEVDAAIAPLLDGGLAGGIGLAVLGMRDAKRKDTLAAAEAALATPSAPFDFQHPR